MELHAHEDCGHDNMEFCQWRWQMECTMDHIDGTSFWKSRILIDGDMGWSCIRFLYRQTLTSVVTIEWRYIHPMESWCSNHAASIVQKPKSTIAIWWIFDFKVFQVMLKFCFLHISKRELYFNLLWLIAIDPFLMAADCPRQTLFIRRVTLSFTPYPLFQWYVQSKEVLLNLGMKFWNSAFNAQGSRVIIIHVQVRAVKIYVAAVETLL
jgi:hypothetical protein